MIDAEVESDGGGDGSATTDDGPDGGPLGPEPDWTPAALASIRADSRTRRVALAVAAAVGLALAWVHWLGLFAAGALVGLVSRTPPRAVVAGVAFGVLVLVVTVVASPVMGPREFLGLTPPVYVAAAAALLAPAWGSLLRGVV